jgi:hypothetical protein
MSESWTVGLCHCWGRAPSPRILLTETCRRCRPSPTTTGSPITLAAVLAGVRRFVAAQRHRQGAEARAARSVRRQGCARHHLEQNPSSPASLLRRGHICRGWVWHCEPAWGISGISGISGSRFGLSTASGCWHCWQCGRVGTTSPLSARSGVSSPSKHRRD